MTLKGKKFLMLATAMIVGAPLSYAIAASTNMDATANFRTAITLTPTNMDFSDIDVTAAPGAGDTYAMGTNNAIIAAGVFSTSGGASPAAGTVVVNTGDVGATVEVRCDASATMADAGGATIGVAGIEVTDSAATAAYGAGNACNGVGGAAATTLVLDGTDSFSFGGQIDGSTQAGVWAGGAYSTGNAGGDDIQVDVIYQ